MASFWKRFRENQSLKIRVFFFLVLIIFFSFGIHHLKDFVSFDEHYWLYNPDNDRIHQYWEAISKGDWEDTRINDKPGITLAYTAGVGLLLEKNLEAQVLFKDGTVKIFDPEKTREINLFYRFPILLVSGLFAFYFFWIVKKITDSEWTALFTVAFLYLSPVIIGMSQIVNPDSMFWVFGFSSILTFLALLKLNHKKYFWLTILFFGLSMASKYVSIIFIPFFFFMMLSFYLFDFSNWQGKMEELRKRIIRNGLFYWGIILGGFAIFALMMPAVIVKPKYFYEGTVGFPGMAPIFWAVMAFNFLMLIDMQFLKGKISFYLLEKLGIVREWAPKIVSAILLLTVVFVLINWMSRHRLIDLTDISFDMKRKPDFEKIPFIYRFIMEAVPLTFALTPIALFSLIYLWSKNIFQKLKHNYLAFILSSFILIFYVAVIKQGLMLTIRYSIILYPVAALLAALSVGEFFESYREKINSRKFLMFFSGIAALILIFFALSSIEQAKLISEKELRIFYNFHRIIFGLISLALFGAGSYLFYALISWKKLEKLNYFGAYLVIVLASVISIGLISPYYFSYSNDFLPKKYIITSGWGYGGYEAAQYMNQLPNAKNSTVWTDSYGFCEFFVGKCIHKIKVRTDQYPIDYLYSTLQNQLRPQWIGNKSYREDGNPIWNLEIDGRYKNYVRIFKAKEIAGNSDANVTGVDNSGASDNNPDEQ